MVLLRKKALSLLAAICIFGTSTLSFGGEKRTFLAYISKKDNPYFKIKIISLKKENVNFDPLARMNGEDYFERYPPLKFKISSNFEKSKTQSWMIDGYFNQLGKRVEKKFLVSEEDKKNGLKNESMNLATRLLIDSFDVLQKAEDSYLAVKDYFTIKYSFELKRFLNSRNTTEKLSPEKVIGLGTGIHGEDGRFGLVSTLKYDLFYLNHNWYSEKIKLGATFSFLDVGYEKIAWKKEKIFVNFAKVF